MGCLGLGLPGVPAHRTVQVVPVPTAAGQVKWDGAGHPQNPRRLSEDRREEAGGAEPGPWPGAWHSFLGSSLSWQESRALGKLQVVPRMVVRSGTVTSKTDRVVVLALVSRASS